MTPLQVIANYLDDNNDGDLAGCNGYDLAAGVLAALAASGYTIS